MPATPKRRDTGASSVMIALIAVASALVLLIGYAVVVAVTGSDPAPSASPSPSASATSSVEPSATPTEGGLPATWAEVPAADRPPAIAAPRPGEPPAREWAPWILDYVGADWDVEIWGEPNPAWDGDSPSAPPDRYLYQALYLVAPDGDRFRIYVLRTDIGLGIEAKALDEHIVWITRYFYEASQTVQFDLETGTASETWADTGFANANPTQNADGWFVYYLATLTDGRMLWEGSGYGEPLNGVFFRAPGGVITPSGVNPNLSGGMDFAPDCVGVDTADSVAIYVGHTYASGQPVSDWPARLVVHNLASDTWTINTRLGPYGTPCHDDFDVAASYYVGLANRTDQSGLYRYYFDGSPDQPN